MKYLSNTMQELLKILKYDVSLKELYPELMKLAAIASLILTNTAECYTMNRVKTDLRNRLKTDTLDCLIIFEGPPAATFDFGHAADMWGGMRSRILTIT